MNGITRRWSLIFTGLALTCISGVKAQQIAPAPAATQSPKIQVGVNSVLVPVVVMDEQGRAVANLVQQNFQVMDEGKLRAITGFSAQQHAPALNGTHQAPSMSANAAGAAPSIATPSSATPPRFIVFLFDDLHLSAGDLMQVQKASSAMLASSLGASDTAAVVSMSGSNGGLTRDHEQLQQAIGKLHMHNLYRQAAHECPDVNYYHADLIENRHDGPALESAIRDALNCGHLDLREVAERMVHSAASRALALGDQDVRVSLGMIREMVQRMAALPGERTLILVSPGFLTITAEALEEKSQIMDLAAQSSVIVSALDARELYSVQIDASERGDATAMDLVTGSPSQDRRDQMSLNRYVMAELAAATGGTYFRDSNDLQGGFTRLAASPETLYLLEFSLQSAKLDGRYHRLSVKIDQPHLHLQCRPGYVAARPKKQ